MQASPLQDPDPTVPLSGVPAAPLAPPILPGPLGSAGREPAWPRVFGILSIVLGGLAVLQGIFGVLSLFFVGSFFGFMPGGGQQMKAAMDQSMPLNIALQTTVALLGL